MYYFKLNEDIIEKYEVIIKEKALQKLKEKIMQEDCLVIPGELRASFFVLSLTDFDYEIRNIKNEGYLFTRENLGGPDKDIYLFTFDKIIYNEEVLLINRLLNHDVSALEEIFTSQEAQAKNKKLVKLIKLNLVQQISLKDARTWASFLETDLNINTLNRQKRKK